MPSSASRHQRITGEQAHEQYFRFREYEHYQPDAVVDVLRGRSAGAIFRGAVPASTCSAIADRFWASPHRRTRGAEAPGYYLGTYHYHRTTNDYLAESAKVADTLDAVLGTSNDPLAAFYDGLKRVLAAEGVNVRLAQHEGAIASRGLLRSWHGQGEYALEPHEDLSQCREPRQAGFEIQNATKFDVVALNISLENGSGGRLGYWNIRPDDESKRLFGLHYTGSPYPLEALDGFEEQWIDIRQGDIYVFNGAHVHAVEPSSEPGERRTTLAAMLGFIDPSTVVTWT